MDTDTGKVAQLNRGQVTLDEAKASNTAAIRFQMAPGVLARVVS